MALIVFVKFSPRLEIEETTPMLFKKSLTGIAVVADAVALVLYKLELIVLFVLSEGITIETDCGEP
ncbi:MAG: hypothetical protein WAO94_03045 [Dysgonamonadaceae bacterium]